MTGLTGKRILVTGATGFIGGRLIERLVLEEGAEVVALVHQFRNASRLARFPLKMIGGNVADADVVRRAAEGCDAIIHAAVSFAGTADENRSVAVEGTRNICEGALAARARRVVHFSTLSVYGVTPPGPLSEASTRQPRGDAYGASKLESEQLVQAYQSRGLSATILQPTIVYGPWSFWSVYAARLMQAGELALPQEGSGLCNAVYVDDVVDAVLLALKREEAAPGPYLVSATAPTTWKDFFQAHASRPTSAAIVGMTAAEEATLTRNPKLTANYWKGFIHSGVRIHAGALKHEIMIALRGKNGSAGADQNAGPGRRPATRVLPMREHMALLSSGTAVEIQRAVQELGYRPRYDLGRGRMLMSQWLRWAGFGEETP